MRGVLRVRAVLAVAITALVLVVAGAFGSTVALRAALAAPAAPMQVLAPRVNAIVLSTPLGTVPTTDQCLSQLQLHCYQPAQIQRAYDLWPLYAQGMTGVGRTIVIVDAFGSPTIQHDLQVFDQTFGLPDPPQFTILQPAGPVPPFDPTNSDMTGWAGETTLDVEWSHVIAPGANILLVETPVAETEGVTGFPEIVTAENYVLDHNLGDVITQSFGATEATFPSSETLLALRGSFLNAHDHQVTVLGASGDDGATGALLDGTCCYTTPVVAWPSSDPLVTSVGGTRLLLDASGTRTAPDAVWNDHYGASGGGASAIFAQPGFQSQFPTGAVAGFARNTPDISMSAAVDGGVVCYDSYDPAQAGYHIVGGTSEAAPLFAGIVAIADQMAQGRLGDLNNRLYRLASQPASGIVDVMSGTNTFVSGTSTVATVPGYAAGPGYDLASGLGTVDAAVFVPALVRDAQLFPNQDDMSRPSRAAP